MVAPKKTLLLQVLAASYAEDEIQTRYYLTPFAVTAAHEYSRNTLRCPYLPYPAAMCLIAAWKLH